MTATCTLGVVGVDRATVDRRNRVLDKTTLVERVGVDRHLHIVVVGNAECGTYCGGSRAPILVDLQTARARLDLLDHRSCGRTVTLAEQTHIDGQTLERTQDHLDRPAPRSDCGSVSSVGGANASAKERRDTATQCVVGLLGRDDVYVTVDTACREDQVLARNGVGRRTRNQLGRNALHSVGVARLAQTRNATVLDTHVGLHHALNRVDDRHVGDHQIERTLVRGDCVCQTHTVANGLATAIDRLVAIGAQVALDLDIEIAIAQTDFVAHGRAIQIVIFLTRNFCHSSLLFFRVLIVVAAAGKASFVHTGDSCNARRIVDGVVLRTRVTHYE